MNKILLALLASTMPLLSSANTLVFTPTSNSFAINGYDSIPATGSVISGQFGQFSTTGPGTLTATFLGSEAGFSNFYMQYGSLLTGASVSAQIAEATNVVDFHFDTSSPTPADSSIATLASNSEKFTSESPLSFALLDVANGEDGAYYIGFNDYFAGTPDFDDYVVKLTYATTVPVPASLPLMASALGLFGFGVSRKRLSKSV